ncbi:hypothetical protein GGF32_002789 [Allomyces javanicus]|nr:hypothetical protein GGF32_002789 [Allomyces javanicus]
MKVIDKLRRAHEQGRQAWSFEYFPPKTQQGVLNLYDRLERMYALAPEFIDVTWGAGGTTADLTMDICHVAQAVYGLETCMHLTCTNMPRDKIDTALQQAREIGIQNILALRGDPPRGQAEWTACDNGFAYAVDLVKYIREAHGDWFCIGVAGYPEGHLENPDKDADLRHLKAKIDAGADYIVTQMFYDVDLFLDWVRRCRAIGISCPILPGIMPIQTFGGFKRMTTLSQTIVPQAVLDALEPIKDDDQKVKAFGIQLAIDMCKRLRDESDIFAFHFYTMNLERSVRLILEGLEFVAPLESARPLPWNPSLHKKRTKENVRPIFWRHRPRSYVQRTAAWDWDEFPNGRWGDARSPAYGELDGWGASIKHSNADCLKLWGHPTTPRDLARVFVKYCRGKISALPWSDQPLAPESRPIASLLEQLNARGCLTINSQPPVNGAPSTDAVHGWGPRGGYVYQKAYLEVFVSPQVLDALANRLATTPDAEFVSFHAINRAGDLRTNEADPNSPNAVTWGVFPGKEIVQPTIVDLTSFMAWKDEAFELWTQWRNVYPANSPAYTNIDRVASDWYLVTIVHNDFHQPESALVNLILAAAADVDGVPVGKTPSIVEDLLKSEPASVPEVASSIPSSPPAANGIKKLASGAPVETAVAPAVEPASRPATGVSKATNGVATKLSTVSACSPAAPAVTAVSS